MHQVKQVTNLLPICYFFNFGICSNFEFLQGVPGKIVANNPTGPAGVVKSKDSLNILAAPVNLSKAINNLELDDKTMDW